MIDNLFKDIVPEDSEEPSDKDKSSESNPDEDEEFYNQLSDNETEHQPKKGGGIPIGYGGGIQKPKKVL